MVGGGIRDGNELSCLRFNVCFRFLHFLLTPELSHPWRTGSNPQLDNREDESQFHMMLLLYDNYAQDYIALVDEEEVCQPTLLP